MAGFPYVSQIQDPAAQKAVKAAFDQITALANRIAALEQSAILNTGSLNANGQRLINLASPQAPTDAVTLSAMQQFVLAQVETFG